MSHKRVSDKEIVVSASVPNRHKPATTRAKRSAAVVAVAPETQTPQELPSREQIAALAYSYWVGRGRQGGSPEADWLHAEQELAAKPQAASAATA
jgi:hypothetical protein